MQDSVPREHGSSLHCCDEDPGIRGIRDEDRVDEPDSRLSDEEPLEIEDSAGDDYSFASEILDVPLNNSGGTTLREAVALDFAMALRHNWSYESLIDNFVNKNTLFGGRYFPTNKKALWRTIGKNDRNVLKHAYCNKGTCAAYIGRLGRTQNRFQCPTCNNIMKRNEVKWFITLDLKKELKQFLETPGMAESMQYRENRRKRGDERIEDIYDGKAYKKLQEEGLLGDMDFSYVFNTDGVNVMKNAKLKAWPVFIRLNELPPSARQKNMFLAALWVDNSDPNMLTLLQPFVETANQLSLDGVKWCRPGDPPGEEVVSKFLPTCHCSDSVARCSVMNMVACTGYNACIFCTMKGVYQDNCVRYPADGVRSPRTADSFIADMITAHETGKTVRGVHGPTQLLNMEHFDPVESTASDDLHTIHEGVVPHHNELLLTIGKMSVARKVAIIDQRMSQIRCPTNVARKPSPFSNRHKWKGSEWRNWLLFYSTPCLEGLDISRAHVEHWEMLVYAAYLLSQESITEEEVDIARDLLHEYVRLFEALYGLKSMLYNVHLLDHFADCVKLWGPLWAYSTFNFESWNFRLKRGVHSAKDAADQIITRYFMKKLIVKATFDEEHFSEAIRQRICEIMWKKTKKVSKQIGIVRIHGQDVTRQPSRRESEALQREGFTSPTQVTVYPSVSVKGSEYRRQKDLSRTEKVDNTCLYTWDDTFCTVQDVIVFDVEGQEVCGLFVFEHSVQSTFKHAKNVALMLNDDLFHFLPVDKIAYPAIKVKIDERTFIMPISNRHEVD